MRIGAVQGMVRIDYVNVRTGEESHKVHPPAKAELLARQVAQAPEKGRPVDMICAIMEAARHARYQNGSGENPAMVGMSFKDALEAGMKEELEAVLKDIEQERRKDPLLDAEMRQIEEEQVLKFLMPDKSRI